MERSKVAPVISALIERTIGEMAECPDFTGSVREGIQPVIVSVLRFLAHRQNTQGGGAGSRTAYLFQANAREKKLGDDLSEWFYGSGLYNFTAEPQEVGGGRADLIFNFDSFRFVIELKRDKTNTSVAGLKKNYLRQAATYQVTDIPIGMLMVLDLTGTPPGHIRDNVWVDRVPPTDPGGTERFVVVVRIPGNRKVPSKV